MTRARRPVASLKRDVQRQTKDTLVEEDPSSGLKEPLDPKDDFNDPPRGIADSEGKGIVMEHPEVGKQGDVSTFITAYTSISISLLDILYAFG